MARISYTKGEGSQFQPYPEGTYDIQIGSAEQGTSKSGNPQLTVKGEIVDGEYAGKKVTIWYSLLPQSTWKLDALFDALGIQPQETGELDENGKPIMACDTDELLQRTVRYNCTQRTYEGRVNNNWDKEAISPLDVHHDKVVSAKKAAAAAKSGGPTNTAGNTASPNTSAPAAPQTPPQTTAAPSAAGQPLARRPRPAAS